jgi:MFS family permease
LVRRTPVLLVVLVSASTVTFAAGCLNVLDVFFLPANLRADPRWYGLLGAAFGVGSIAGALLTARVVGRLGLARTYWLGLLLTGVFLIGYARSTTLVVALGMIVLAGVPVAVVSSLLGPIILKATPREYLGAAVSVVNPVLQLVTIGSIALAGCLVSSVLRDLHATVAGLQVGRVDAVLAAAGTLIVLAAAWTATTLRESPSRATPSRDVPSRDAPSRVDLGEVGEYSTPLYPNFS